VKLDEGSGTVAKDSSGNGHDGTLEGGAQWVDAYFAGGLKLGGFSDRVVVPYSAELNPEEAFTVSFWANVEPGSIYPDYDDYRSPFCSRGKKRGYNIYINPDGNWQFWIGTGGWSRLTGPAVQTGQWTHVAGVYDKQKWNGQQILYVNGVQVNSNEDVVIRPNTEAYLAIGSAGTLSPEGELFFVGMLDDVRVYNRALTQKEIQKIIMRPELTSKPNPADEATDVPRDDVVLNWTPGDFADKHDVYFGTNSNDVNDATTTVVPAGVYIGRQSETAYALGRLDLGQTYYWRIDEVNAPPTSHVVFKGDVWSFTAEPDAYPLAGENITAIACSSNNTDEGPENTVNGSGLDADDLHSTEITEMWLSGSEPNGAWIQYEFDEPYKLHEMWIWNYNGELLNNIHGVKEATIEYSADGVNWTALGGVPEFAQAPGTADYAADISLDLEGIVAQAVRITASSNWSGGIVDQYGLSEIQFLAIPLAAREISPADGTILPGLTAELSWRAGRQAEFHDVYISTDIQAVIDSTAPVERVNTTQYTAEFDLLDTTYYWKVNEVNEAEVPAVWEGPVQSFTTSAFLVIEDFEDYNAYDNQIWWSWKDGLGYVEHDGQPAYPGNGTGSATGDETTATFMEMVIVKGGAQSLPVRYNNNKGDFAKYSETALTLPTGKRDWTKGSPGELSLWFRGEEANILERLYVAVADTAVVYHEDPNATQLTEWTEWVIPLETLAGQGISLTNVDSIAVGMGTRGNATIPGGAGKMYFDEIRLYKTRE